MTSPTASIVGIVLAAGAATRMGRLKQLLPYQGGSILQAVVDAAEASRLDEVVIVTGAEAAEVEAGIRASRAIFVRNPDYRRGNMSSLECGANARAEAAAYVLLMSDQPEVSVETIDAMVDLWAAAGPWAAVTEYRDRTGHPFLLSRAAFEEAAAIGGPKLLWHLLAEDDQGRVVRIAADRLAPVDVNTPREYEALDSTANPES